MPAKAGGLPRANGRYWARTRSRSKRLPPTRDALSGSLQGDDGSGGTGGGQLDTTVGDSAVGLSKDGEDDADLAPPSVHPGQLDVFDLLGDG
jgi:hypothetical protein